jgi:two-component system phosphate regulon response regulator PhoB
MDKFIAFKKNLLVIDDEEDILDLLKFQFSNSGFRVTCADTGEKALRILKTQTPDLIILDLMLPGIDGLELLKNLMSNPRTKNIPVIILSAKNEETDIVIGMELGASDYVTKPFSVKVLLSRSRALLRSSMDIAGDDDQDENNDMIYAGDLVLNPKQLKVTTKEKSIELTQVEYKIFSFLARNPGNVYSRKQIASAIHSEEFIVTERSVDVHIYGLRKKLGESRDCIETIWRVGYRLKG